MKITRESADELVLQEGSSSGMIVGILFVIAGAGAGTALRSSTPYAVWIGAAVIVIGIAVILFASAITVSVNRKTGTVDYEKKRLLGAKSSRFAIGDILRIETRRQWQRQDRPT